MLIRAMINEIRQALSNTCFPRAIDKKMITNRHLNNIRMNYAMFVVEKNKKNKRKEESKISPSAKICDAITFVR